MASPGAEHRALLRRLRQHLRYHGGAGIVYLFSDYPLANQWLATELDAHLRTQGRCLRQLQPASPDALPEEMLASLLAPSEETPCLPCWLTLSEPAPAWDACRDRVLARLNENRALLERGRRFVFLLLPAHFETRAAQIAPDLWSVRSATYVVAPWGGGEQPEEDRAVASRKAPAGEADLPSAAVLERWERQWQAWQADRSQHLSPALPLQLARQFLDAGLPAQAQELAGQAVEICRRRVELNGENRQQWRDLSMALDLVGESKLELRQLQAAQAAFQESLEICRRLVVQDGESSLSLRDLSVALDNVGNAASELGQLDAARSAYHESLEIRRRLITQDGESSSRLRDLSIVLDNVGDVARALGRLDAARSAYHESLAIHRRILAEQGESVRRLRDLSVSLDNVGDVARQLGQLGAAHSAFHESLAIRRRILAEQGAAHAAYQEGLGISRKIVNQFGESPQSLRDLCISLKKVGDLAWRQGKLDDARAAYAESLDICRRIAAQTGESPQSLRDLAITLKQVAKLANEQGDHEAEMQAMAEHQALQRRVDELYR